MHLRSLRALAAAAGLGIFSLTASAAPILISIYDYDFTIQTDSTSAVYQNNGTAPDTLTLTSAAQTSSPAAPSYQDFSGGFPAPAPGSTTANGQQYPIWSLKGADTSFTFSGLLSLTMSFSGQDSPYVSGTDQLVSLTGTTGQLTISGIVSPSQPNSGTNMTLLAITLSDLSLVARPGDTVAQVTAEGTITTLFGETPGTGFTSAGLVTFDFGTTQALFSSINYTTADNVDGTAIGYLSGEAGVGAPGSGAPEPASLGLLGLGALALLRRRDR